MDIKENKIEITLSDSDILFLKKYKWINSSELLKEKINEVRNLLTPKQFHSIVKVRKKYPELHKEFYKVLNKHNISIKELKSRKVLINNKHCVVYKHSKDFSKRNRQFLFKISEGTYKYLKDKEDFVIILLCGRNISFEDIKKLIDNNELTVEQIKLLRQPIIEFVILFNKETWNLIKFEELEKKAKDGWIVNIKHLNDVCNIKIGDKELSQDVINNKLVNNFRFLGINNNSSNNIKEEINILANDYIDKIKLIEDLNVSE